MRQHNYIKIGQTKAIDIDFTYLFPRIGLFVNVNMLLEFTLQGQVIPTRFDVLPYKLSPFYRHNDIQAQIIIDIFKAFLVLYIIWTIMTDLAKYKSISQILSFKAISNNFYDLLIVFSQLYTFYIKASDSSTYDIMTSQMLHKENRDKHTNFYFLARNFRAQINFETISLLFMIRKIFNSLRIVNKFNTIFMILDDASQKVFTCTLGIIFFTAFLVPFAQSIWGHQVFGYKTNFHCLNSLIMLSYSKGSFEEVMHHNSYWAFLFISMYYFIFIFFMRSAFHYLQQDAAQSVSLQTGFTKDLLEKQEKIK